MLKTRVLIILTVPVFAGLFYLTGCKDADPENDAGDAVITAVPSEDAVSPAKEFIPPAVERPLFDADSCPEHLFPLFGLGERAKGYAGCKRIVEELGSGLSAEEKHALYAYLYLDPKEVGLDRNGYDALGDVILLKLEEQEPLPADYADHLMTVYSDTSRHANWRDYCIQHLGAVYTEVEPEQQAMIARLFMDTVEENPVVAGTALYSMKNAGFSPELVRNQAIAVAANEEVPGSSRLSALHIAADLNHPEALPLARSVAVSKESVHFRMAAISVLGKLGGSSDLALLEKYSSSSDIRLRESSRAAIKAINDRNARMAADH